MTSLAYRTPTERAVDGDLAILETCVSALRARAWTPEQLSRLGRVVARLDAMVAERYGDQKPIALTTEATEYVMAMGKGWQDNPTEQRRVGTLEMAGGCRCAVIEVDGGELHDLGCAR